MLALIDFSNTTDDETPAFPAKNFSFSHSISHLKWLPLGMFIIYLFSFFNIFRLYFSYPNAVYYYTLFDVVVVGIVLIISLAIQHLFLENLETKIEDTGYFLISQHFKKLWLFSVLSPLVLYIMSLLLLGHTYNAHKLSVFMSFILAVSLLIYHGKTYWTLRETRLCHVEQE